MWRVLAGEVIEKDLLNATFFQCSDRGGGTGRPHNRLSLPFRQTLADMRRPPAHVGHVHRIGGVPGVSSLHFLDEYDHERVLQVEGGEEVAQEGEDEIRTGTEGWEDW
mmetsp:Transcript_6922/g.17084  ORF Transcript_6922/g.17084 Transcript_6922/m.17084 type:complete len:108 (+) Transcript_6922:3-326(+)